ncbi:DUF3558 domain-containing protein [Saccharopolyspora sp. 5N102]|uniref:DUF3558 domain-containing protein n=1 Tax=Saccharopolyspora sp. 5N102 TaxID=3375155 RepID=UPI00378DFD37
MRTTTLAAAASLFVLALASCSSSTPGDPEPTTSGHTTSTASDPLHISQPRNLKAISDPCRLLTSSQLQQLNAGAAQPGQSQWGQASCSWRNQQLRIDVSPDTVQGQGIKYTAKIYGDGQGKPNAEVKDFPAVHFGKSEIFCTAAVGVSDTEQFLVNFTVGTDGRINPEYADPCAMADKIAGIVLENLPPA